MSLDPNDFAYVADLLGRDAAISLDTGKGYLVQTYIRLQEVRHAAAGLASARG